jgi:5,10-methylenetetrahydromethanopterin reductase
MSPIGFGFLDRPSVREQLRLARKAEALGYDSLWVTETRLARDAISVLGAMAACTDRIRLGSGIVNSWTRGPALMAVTFATLDNLAPGRMCLGLGAYWDPLAWKQGIERRKPLTQMREYIGVVRRLLALEEGVTFEGELVQVRDLTLDLGHGDPREPPQVRIAIGPTGPKMTELTGEIADIALLNGILPPSYTRDALARLRTGAERAGRRLEDVETLQLVNVSMDHDVERARYDAKRLVTQYLGQQPHFARALDYPDDALAELVSVMGGWPPRPGGIEDAMALVDDALVDDLIAHGTPEQCRESAARWLDAGLDQIVLIPLSRNYDEILDTFAPGGGGVA